MTTPTTVILVLKKLKKFKFKNYLIKSIKKKHILELNNQI